MQYFHRSTLLPVGIDEYFVKGAKVLVERLVLYHRLTSETGACHQLALAQSKQSEKVIIDRIHLSKADHRGTILPIPHKNTEQHPLLVLGMSTTPSVLVAESIDQTVVFVAA